MSVYGYDQQDPYGTHWMYQYDPSDDWCKFVPKHLKEKHFEVECKYYMDGLKPDGNQPCGDDCYMVKRTCKHNGTQCWYQSESERGKYSKPPCGDKCYLNDIHRQNIIKLLNDGLRCPEEERQKYAAKYEDSLFEKCNCIFGMRDTYRGVGYEPAKHCPINDEQQNKGKWDCIDVYYATDKYATENDCYAIKREGDK